MREVVWRFLAGRDVVASPGHLATLLGTVYGDALTVLSASLGDLDAMVEVGRPPIPALP